ncbi:MAG: phasin family protein [Acidimicrobiales bacterium]
MAQRDLINRSLAPAREAGEKAQERLEALINDLRKTAEDQAEQARQMAEDLVERSRKNNEKLLKAIDAEIRSRLSSVGVATKEDIARLERKIEALSKATGAKTAAKKTTKKTAKKAAAKKAAAKTSSR